MDKRLSGPAAGGVGIPKELVPTRRRAKFEPTGWERNSQTGMRPAAQADLWAPPA
jgi:hypothetical protein